MATTRGAFMTVVLVVVLVDLLFSGCCASARPFSTLSSDPDDEVYQSVVHLFVAIAVFFGLVFFSTIIVTLCLRLCYQRNTPRYSVPAVVRIISFEKVGFNAYELKKIPKRLYEEVKEFLAGKRAVECAVCLCEFEDRDQLRLLPGCGHAFHRDCIDAWLASHLTCPFCRGNIVDALATSENEIEDCATFVNSNSTRETSEQRHEVLHLL